MNWSQRYRWRERLRYSLWPIPLLGMIAALILWPVVRGFDDATNWPWLNFGPEGARALVGTLLAALLTFIVFVFSTLLLVVQLASAQLTPRVIARTFNDIGVKLTLAVMVFVFTFDLGVLARIEGKVPQLEMVIGGYGSLICIAMFIILIDRVGKLLRPITILTSVGSEGRLVVASVYPHRLDEHPEEPDEAAPQGEPTRIVLSPKQPGVLLAFHQPGLLELAARHDCVIELVPQVGDFVPTTDPLFRIYGPAQLLTDDDLRACVAIGPERTVHQDPAFSFRILVDIANKALSPAINDPTTAVLALDQVHHLLREVGWRHLDPGRIRDSQGRLRLIYRTPNWEDFVELAMTEIRHFGATSVQIMRRMRALLEQLLRALPAERHPALLAELALLDRTIERTYADPHDQLRAGASDTQGMGAVQVTAEAEETNA